MHAQLVSHIVSSAQCGKGLEPITLGRLEAAEEIVDIPTVTDPGLAERFNSMLEFVPDRRYHLHV